MVLIIIIKNRRICCIKNGKRIIACENVGTKKNIFEFFCFVYCMKLRWFGLFDNLVTVERLFLSWFSDQVYSNDHVQTWFCFGFIVIDVTSDC